MPTLSKVRTPTFTLSYAGVDITASIVSFCESITYRDNKEGESDDVDIALDNSSFVWMDSWLPAKGDLLTLTLGYVGEPLLGPIEFELDTRRFQGVPDMVHLKGLATPISKPLRQKNTKAFENTNLKEIAQKIADSHGMELVGKIKDIPIQRITQKDQTDLDFLKAEAAKYGLIFKIEGTKKLVFYQETELEAADAILILDRTNLSSYEIEDGTTETFKSASVSYQDPATGSLTTHTAAADPKAVTAQDSLKINRQVENEQQAIEQSSEELRRANRGEIKARIEFEGMQTLAAGANIKLTGFWKYDGKYQVVKVEHLLTRSNGYRGTAELERLEPLEPNAEEPTT